MGLSLLWNGRGAAKWLTAVALATGTRQRWLRLRGRLGRMSMRDVAQAITVRGNTSGCVNKLCGMAAEMWWAAECQPPARVLGANVNGWAVLSLQSGRCGLPRVGELGTAASVRASGGVRLPMRGRQ